MWIGVISSVDKLDGIECWVQKAIGAFVTSVSLGANIQVVLDIGDCAVNGCTVRSSPTEKDCSSNVLGALS
jgi:hypothetical protein